VAQVKKISVKNVYGKIKLSELIERAKKGEVKVPVMRVVGVATGTRTGISDLGDYTALEGTFRATNPETGEVSAASILYLPDVALIPIQVALTSSKAVEFAIMVQVEYVAEKEGFKDGGSPYEYSFESLIPHSADDPLARLEAKVLALTAPKEEEKQPAKGKK